MRKGRRAMGSSALRMQSHVDSLAATTRIRALEDDVSLHGHAASPDGVVRAGAGGQGRVGGGCDNKREPQPDAAARRSMQASDLFGRVGILEGEGRWRLIDQQLVGAGWWQLLCAHVAFGRARPVNPPRARGKT